ncbi:MAG: hypothetical protein F6K16_00725 [Symploca sp. SIO2B6]|nr:hypothetical protein [Symploca sp. SIO2B6]
MVAVLVRKLLSATMTKLFRTQVIFWFSLNLLYAAIYNILVLQEAFSSEYIVQDDARQHVFWMQRFLDPGLFPNDLIANYFQSVAPIGYTKLYQLAAAVGINPLLFNKLLPVVLSLITLSYCFGVCLQLLPVPAAAFTATLLLTQGLGLTSTVVSGTPRAFIYPLFLAFMYYLLKGSLLPCLIAIALQGLFYPQLVLISAGTLSLKLWEWRNGKLHWCHNQKTRLLSGMGLAISLLVMLPYAFKSSEFGAAISVTEARGLPEFFPGGRSSFFYDHDPVYFWLEGRGGIHLSSALKPFTNAAGFLLLLLPCFPRQFPLVNKIAPGINLLSQILIASFGMFFAAHALLFTLHLPSRYTGHTLRMVMSLSAGIVIIVLIDAIFYWIQQLSRRHLLPSKLPVLGSTILTLLIAASLLWYPSFLEEFPVTNYKVGKEPSLYKFFQNQPQDSLIASLSREASYLPTFAQRSVLIGSEYAIPYHTGYYHQFRQRILDLITAQYSPNPTILRDFIDKYQITFWLLDRDALTLEYIVNNGWLQAYQPAITQAQNILEHGKEPALLSLRTRCSLFETENLIALQAECLTKQVISNK